MTSQFLKICTEDRKMNFGLVVCEANTTWKYMSLFCYLQLISICRRVLLELLRHSYVIASVEHSCWTPERQAFVKSRTLLSTRRGKTKNSSNLLKRRWGVWRTNSQVASNIRAALSRLSCSKLFVFPFTFLYPQKRRLQKHTALVGLSS